jgi:hypothetical protein
MAPSVADRCPTAEELRRRILDACEPTRPADPTEVAAYVTRIARPRRLRWRRQIEEILALRARMGEVVQSAREATLSDVTPSSPPLPQAVAIEEPTLDAGTTIKARPSITGRPDPALTTAR